MNPVHVTSNGSSDFITQLHPNDVLFGRGSGPNDHEGNIHFRSLVGGRKAEYMATNHRQTKAKIARDIVGSVLEKNGRFLKKVEAAEAKRLGIPKGVDAWISVDEETIMEKAKQALRQQRDKGKPGGVSPNSSPVPSARKTYAVPITSSSGDVDPYGAVAPVPQYRTSATTAAAAGVVAEANEAALRQANHMQNVAEYAQPAQLHPNPYEPIPIGHNAVGPNNTNLEDWRNYTASYTAAAIMGQTQGLTQQDYSQAQQQQEQPTPQLDISNVAGGVHMPPPPSRSDARRESIQVSDLMDSFNKMKTKELDSQYGSTETIGTISSRNNESTDTMGTIEPLPTGPGKVPLSSSELAMSGSTLSMMRGALEGSSQFAMLKGGYGDSGIDPKLFSSDQLLPPGDVRRSSITKPSGRRDSSRASISIEDKDFFRKATKGASSSEMSMSFSQVWNEKRPGNLGNVTEGDETQGDSHKKVAPGAPRAVDTMEDDPDTMSGLGKSSMSILNIAMGESQGESIMTANESIFSDIGD
mmetsp:Transcript_27858/g.46208  ORF Transcript_27858/g.46208 Transcript_27858/m.46208 type:complete len:527 (-) Transcript_27858:62-1642(-)|eukprot:CAMPEP_0119011378 /NCGR_PEP_ID=MMETSP1176-20130426/5640_1 /TAXON_ID=265551 /ORGANISM="Synedropsis recta cf, Strain CCMP1620" /LENGTH=526 /DNA_ID=CAMNT_0006964201 /DNA_START=138 /DNA_END=1718 /DNA_ORIENTATION=-